MITTFNSGKATEEAPMKNQHANSPTLKTTTTRNGSATPLAHAIAEQHGEYMRAGAQEWEEKREVQREAAEQATKIMKVKVRAHTYGLLCKAGVIHDCTPEDALVLLLEDTDALNEWTNTGCCLTVF